MALSEQERGALRGFWLGEPLGTELAAALSARAESPERRQWQDEVRAYLRSISGAEIQRTRRLLLTCSQTAVAVLANQVRGEDEELARRAAVDLLRHFEKAAADELAEVEREASREEQAALERLGDEQVQKILEIMAGAGGEEHPQAALGCGTHAVEESTACEQAVPPGQEGEERHE